ncbi:AaceriADR275Wp [[Ashbya] aceris (nom. inval.)]|nr:AaceriADR275Wp [[Ashbya] aceris (nom. inval.)]
MAGGRNLQRVQFINRALLGRKRSTVEMGADTKNDYVDISADELLVQSQYVTETIEQRNEVVRQCAKLYAEAGGSTPALRTHDHWRFSEWPLSSEKPMHLEILSAAQPWMIYWCANSLKLLRDEPVSEEIQKGMVAKLEALCVEGCYVGGPQQLPHIACTYAAVEALALCDSNTDAWSRIDRESLYRWMLRLRVPGGGFRTTSQVGEIDTRAMYTVLSVASLLQLLTPELTEGCVEYLLECQTYEGGFGGCPQVDEAHGGYTFLAVASLAILGALDRANIQSLMDWCSSRQTNEERGLSGRHNKLVDGCYSFWVGGTAAILEAYGYGQCIDKAALQSYILTCCQDSHGMRDKPGKPADFYHTNYVLLGLATAQYDFVAGASTTDIECTPLGTPDVCPINPIYGIPVKDVRNFVTHFLGT